jgi:ATP-dependent Clp protease ATP-binding subunit ClpA
MFERFTEDARQIVTVAHEEAAMMRHARIGTEHLLVALADEPEVGALGLTRVRARAEVVRTLGLGEAVAARQIPLTPAAHDALEAALGEAMRLGHDEVQPGHVLLAVLKQRDGVARRILVAGGAVPSEFRDAVIQRLATPPAASPLMVRLGEAPLGDIGNPRTDARLLLAILDRGGPVASWLRERGVDETTLRRMLSD